MRLESGGSDVNFVNLTLSNSTNINFILTGVENTNLTDIHLVNTSYSYSGGEYSVFMFKEGRSLVISNLTVKNHIGSMFVVNNMINVNMTSCYFAEIITLTNLTQQMQSFLNLTVDDSVAKKDNLTVTLTGFNINVITYYMTIK